MEYTSINYHNHRRLIIISLFLFIIFYSLFIAALPWQQVNASDAVLPNEHSEIEISRAEYYDRLAGFWLGQSIANWTGLITEMDKIGGPGIHGQFYTREDWGKPDLPSIWGQGVPSQLSDTIDWVLKKPGEVWGSDDDTDIEFIYQFLLDKHQTTRLTPKQIQQGWLTHIYTDENTPFTNAEGQAENYLWVSNQRAHDLMHHGMLPPKTSDPLNNEHFEMIDAQLTTEIFGLFAPACPRIALQMAYLPIRTTARENAAWAAEFYVVMHSLALVSDSGRDRQQQIIWMADQARKVLPNGSYSAHMFDFIRTEYNKNTPWEELRDKVYQNYQVKQVGGYDMTSKNLYCNGCFASGINFAASLISLLYGSGDYESTVKLAVLMGWDSDNPAATWGGLLGFMDGLEQLEKKFGQKLSHRFNIHRTRGNFPQKGIYTFQQMSETGLSIIDRTVSEEMSGKVDKVRNVWSIPQSEHCFN